ncbi:MAG: hypothetical protein R3282_05015 [Rhodothermales bacterium]|nr:hypothetical protein [Rhodothermales bacterium]
MSQVTHDGSLEGTRNVHVVGHLGWQEVGGSKFEAAPELVMEQEIGRPFLYVASGGRIVVIDISDPSAPRTSTSIDLEAASGGGATVVDVDLAKLGDRRYLIVAAKKHARSGPAILIFDMPSPSQGSPQVAASYDAVDSPLTSIFAYKHSSGKALLFAAAGKEILGLDLEMLVEGGEALVGSYPTPPLIDTTFSGFRDVYAAFEPVTQQDRLYGAGAGGYYVYDVTDVSLPAVEAQVSAAAVRLGTRIAASPDGRYLVTAAGYRTSPIYIYDVEPALEKSLPSVRTAVGAWTADWRNRSRSFEVRWPYVFVAALHDGFQMFNMRDASEPYTVGFARTWSGLLPKVSERDREEEGAWDLDVRNADGLIAVSDTHSGVWLIRVDAFEGWHGHSWGQPNASTAQDWDSGPDGASLSGVTK